MTERKRMKSITLIVLSVVLLAILSVWIVKKQNLTVTNQYNTTDEVLYNPYMGFAVAADHPNAVGKNTLVYLDITWRELEPEEGIYDFASIEKRNYLALWKASGKKVVLRFLCDVPGNEQHMDIPDWLYEKTDDGSFYDISYGKGYAPNYENLFFIEKHEAAIKALGDYFGQDQFLAYVELGSLGHWGEWHTHMDNASSEEASIPKIPGEAVCRQYITPYVDAFPNARLLMRRPYALAQEYQTGIYNDMTGEPDSTQEWLSWIENGGSDTDSITPLAYQAVKEPWKENPIGGEFTSSLTMEEMLCTNLIRTISLLEDSHMTFIGPKCPVLEETEQFEVGTKSVLQKIGYRYGVQNSRVTYQGISKNYSVKYTLVNKGVAPMYWDWPICQYLTDENDNVLERMESTQKLSQITGDSSFTEKVTFQGNYKRDEHIKIYVGIENPDTGKPEINLNMNTPENEHMYLL
ncbi:MAG: DUF4832 domain-containing protein, partial [Lachnospiraceae bacterium]|nr:DUF4832 domain-containing protein [Lachnospiraceae bacterium]